MPLCSPLFWYIMLALLSVFEEKKKGQSQDKGNVMSMNVVYEMLPENELIFIIL